MFALVTVPLPIATTQVCDGIVGCTDTVTLYGAPLATGVGNTNAPLLVSGRSSPLLFWSTTMPASPLMVPATTKWSMLHVTITLVTAPNAIVPTPFDTVQTCVGLLGGVLTFTANAAPLAT